MLPKVPSKHNSMKDSCVKMVHNGSQFQQWNVQKLNAKFLAGQTLPNLSSFMGLSRPAPQGNLHCGPPESDLSGLRTPLLRKKTDMGAAGRKEIHNGNGIHMHYANVYFSTILYYTILYYTILYYTILYYTILYYTILYYTILYYTILYYTILY